MLLEALMKVKLILIMNPMALEGMLQKQVKFMKVSGNFQKKTDSAAEFGTQASITSACGKILNLRDLENLFIMTAVRTRACGKTACLWENEFQF